MKQYWRKKITGPYVLTFSSTRTKKFARTKKDAFADAIYWSEYGVKKVCVHKKLPSGRLHLIRCVERGQLR